MSARGQSVTSANSTLAATTPVNWLGGKSVLTLFASSYPTTCFLQTLAQDNSTWINVNAATYSANQVTAYDLPPGQYRMNLSGGTITNLNATLNSVSYG